MAVAQHAVAARPTLGPVLGGAAIVGLLIAIYHRVGATLWTTWNTNDNYSHGPLVPVVAVILAWRARAELTAAPRQSDWRGLLLIGAACAALMLGMRADVFALQGWSLLLMGFGLALVFQGPARTRVLAFPIAWLGFMLTFPPFVVTQLSYGLKEITVRLSTEAAELLGAVVQRSGMSLWLAGGELRVENPCSGLRSLIALLATGTLFARFQPGSWWRRAALVAAAVPIAMFGNAVRLTLLVLVAHYVGVKEATGVFHDWTGYLVYAVALAGLFGVRTLLSPSVPRPYEVPPMLRSRVREVRV